MSMMGFMIATIAPTTKAANASSYGIVLLAIVIESFTSDNNVLIMLFATDASTLVKALRTVLLFYPPFSYTKVYHCLLRSSPTSQSIVAITSMWIRDHGIQDHTPTIFRLLLNQPKDLSSLEVPSKDILTSPQCSSCIWMQSFLRSWHGTLTISWHRTEEELLLCYSLSTTSEISSKEENIKFELPKKLSSRLSLLVKMNNQLSDKGIESMKTRKEIFQLWDLESNV